jgi:hypothetical protein
MKAKFTGEMPDFGVDPITRRAYPRQISREYKMEAMNIFYSRTVQDGYLHPASSEAVGVGM